MKVIVATLLTVMALAAMSVPVVAQGEEAAIPVTVIPNEQFCGLVSDDLTVCEQVLESMATAGLLPEAFASLVGVETPGDVPEDVATAEPSGDVVDVADAGVGDTLSREDVEITLVDEKWKPNTSKMFFKPDKGKMYVAVLVRYDAVEDGAFHNLIWWQATDEDGSSYDASVLAPVEPGLTPGQLEAGKSTQGWVTFEVPNDVQRLEIEESQPLKGALRWTIER